MKLFDYIRLLVTRPSEAYGRLEGIFDSRLEPLLRSRPVYETVTLGKAVGDLPSLIGGDSEFDAILYERELRVVEDTVVRGIASLPPDAPFGAFQNGDLLLGRVCYAICRMLRPQQVVETGVCYGVTSSFLLKALERNGAGILQSIDLPALGRSTDNFIGKLVPPELRKRWELHRGASRLVLPALLRQVGTVDLFIHDSLHTYRNMMREFDMIAPVLNRPAVVISDDIEGNSAFQEWVSRTSPQFSAVIKEERKQSLFGIAVFVPDKQAVVNEAAESILNA